MYKQLYMMKRKPGLSMREFIDYYENYHAKLGEQALPLLRRYIRRYLEPDVHHMTGAIIDHDFDVVMEMWWDSRQDFASTMDILAQQGETLKKVWADEERLFASHHYPTYSVQEFESSLPNGVQHHASKGD